MRSQIDLAILNFDTLEYEGLGTSQTGCAKALYGFVERVEYLRMYEECKGLLEAMENTSYLPMAIMFILSSLVLRDRSAPPVL